MQAVATDGFEVLVKTLDSGSLIPSYKYFTQNKLQKSYSSCREKVEQTACTQTHAHERTRTRYTLGISCAA